MTHAENTTASAGVAVEQETCEIGMVGLGVMGSSLALNMADHGHSVAGWDLDEEKVKELAQAVEARPIWLTSTLEQLVARLKRPRAVMLMVPAGPAVDAVIHTLMGLLAEGDVIIDGGNSHFKDTDLRAKALAERGIALIGMGVSGGEHGARRGPSM